MICAYLAFTDTGLALAKRLAAALPGLGLADGWRKLCPAA